MFRPKTVSQIVASFQKTIKALEDAEKRNWDRNYKINDQMLSLREEQDTVKGEAERARRIIEKLGEILK